MTSDDAVAALRTSLLMRDEQQQQQQQLEPRCTHTHTHTQATYCCESTTRTSRWQHLTSVAPADQRSRAAVAVHLLSVSLHAVTRSVAGAAADADAAHSSIHIAVRRTPSAFSITPI